MKDEMLAQFVKDEARVRSALSFWFGERDASLAVIAFGKGETYNSDDGEWKTSVGWWFVSHEALTPQFWGETVEDVIAHVKELMPNTAKDLE